MLSTTIKMAQLCHFHRGMQQGDLAGVPGRMEEVLCKAQPLMLSTEQEIHRTLLEMGWVLVLVHCVLAEIWPACNSPAFWVSQSKQKAGVIHQSPSSLCSPQVVVAFSEDFVGLYNVVSIINP